jgi:hypothetical protein
VGRRGRKEKKVVWFARRRKLSKLISPERGDVEEHKQPVTLHRLLGLHRVTSLWASESERAELRSSTSRSLVASAAVLAAEGELVLALALLLPRVGQFGLGHLSWSSLDARGAHLALVLELLQDGSCGSPHPGVLDQPGLCGADSVVVSPTRADWAPLLLQVQQRVRDGLCAALVDAVLGGVLTLDPGPDHLPEQWPKWPITPLAGVEVVVETGLVPKCGWVCSRLAVGLLLFGLVLAGLDPGLLPGVRSGQAAVRKGGENQVPFVGCLLVPLLGSTVGGG